VAGEVVADKYGDPHFHKRSEDCRAQLSADGGPAVVALDRLFVQLRDRFGLECRVWLDVVGHSSPQSGWGLCALFNGTPMVDAAEYLPVFHGLSWRRSDERERPRTDFLVDHLDLNHQSPPRATLVNGDEPSFLQSVPCLKNPLPRAA
jgi:hypothetical protein